MPVKKDQQGITLLLALLVLSAISAIAFSLAAIVLVEIRASGDVLRTEPALYAVQGLTEQAFFKYATGAAVNYPSSINNVTLTASAPIKYDDSPKVDVISTYKTYELINADNYGPSGYTSFKVTFLDNGLGSTITVAATEINPSTSAQTVLNPQYISRGGYAFVPVNPAYIYEIIITNNSTSQNVTVSIETTRQGGPPHGLPFVNKKVIDVTATYTNFTRKYRVNVPFAANSTLTNVALGKNTSQSSTYNGITLSSEAVDGNTDGNYGNASVAITNSDTEAWWQVDLGSIINIQSINVWNRTDCCGSRLNNSHIFVSDVPFVSNGLAATQAQSGVSDYPIGTAQNQNSLTISRTGRYVRVQLSSTDYLQLAEVQIFSN